MKQKLKTTKGLPLRVALYPESNGKKMCVAHCMDFDLVAQGKTVQEAQANFLKTLKAHVYLSLKNGEMPFVNIHSEEQSQEPTTPQSVRAATLIPSSVRIVYSKLEEAQTVNAW